MKRLVYLLGLGIFVAACGEGSIRSLDSETFFSQENPFQPVIQILGANPVTIERTTTWADPGAVAQSLREGNLAARVEVDSNLNLQKIGSYQIVYSVSDSQGRKTSVTRQVIVEDTILPTVTINDAGLGASPSFNKNQARSILVSDPSQDAIKYQAVVVASDNCSSADFVNAPQKNISEPFVLNPNLGSNKICVRGIDEAGNIQATPTASRELLIQNPSLLISLNLTSPTNQTSVTVTATGDGIDFFKVIQAEAGTCNDANFSNAETSISTAATFSELPEGSHLFCAIGRNAQGEYDLTQVADATLEVDRTPPTISVEGPFLSGMALDRPIRSADSVYYTVTYFGYSEISLNENHVQLIYEVENATCLNKEVSGTDNPSTKTVTLSNCTGDGTVAITIAANSAQDLAGNQAPASEPSVTFTVDNTAPTIEISGPSVAQVNQSDSVTYTVIYSGHSAINLNAGHVTLNVTGENATCLIQEPTGSSDTRTVTLSDCSGNGTVGITIAANSARDAAGNQALASGPSVTFTVDNTPPTIVIIANGQSYNPVNGAVTVPLELCQDLTLTATADSQELDLPSFDISKTGSSSNSITATDALGNSAAVNLTLNISLPAAYSSYGSATFHRVLNWSDLSVEGIANKNLFLCNDLSFEGDDSFAGIDNYNSIFEGNKKVISNLDTSLFGDLGNTSQVRNLVLKNLAAELTSENTGGLASLNLGLIEQVGIREAELSISCDDCENSFFGGLVGENDGTIKNSYFEGEIQTPTEKTAGLVGENQGSIESSYSSANLNTRALSLVSESDGGEVENSYWNCGEDVCSNGEGESAGTARSPSEMANFESFIGFDFQTIWTMFSNSDYLYPVFQFE